MANSLTRSEPEVIELRPRAVLSSRLSGREGILWILGAAAMLFIGILKGINLTVNTGEVHAIMGPNATGRPALRAK